MGHKSSHGQSTGLHQSDIWPRCVTNWHSLSGGIKIDSCSERGSSWGLCQTLPDCRLITIRHMRDVRIRKLLIWWLENWDFPWVSEHYELSDSEKGASLKKEGRILAETNNVSTCSLFYLLISPSLFLPMPSKPSSQVQRVCRGTWCFQWYLQINSTTICWMRRLALPVPAANKASFACTSASTTCNCISRGTIVILDITQQIITTHKHTDMLSIERLLGRRVVVDLGEFLWLLDVKFQIESRYNSGKNIFCIQL